jgi:hypothetical protein
MTAEAMDPARERLRRWRMVLGGDDADGTGCALSGRDAAMDGALTALYGKGDKAQSGKDRSAGLGASAPSVARWLGDIRTYFPSSVVQVMQRDAIDRLGLSTLLLEPEMLEAVEADVHLVGTLLSLNKAMPETTKETARAVVRKVVEDLEKRLATRTRATLTGALDRSARVSRPRHHDIDWNRTIAANLKNYLPEYRTVVPERLIGYGRASQSVKKEVILCIDQSGSMAASVVYASVFGAVLASMRSISTRLVVFDTAVVDLTDQLDDPVDVLFGTQLGGGTDINRALAYCQSQITRPAFPPLGERFDRLTEQLNIITGLWTTPSGKTFDYAGAHYAVAESPALPKPVQSPHPPIIIGGAGAKRTPALAAQFAAEFNIPFAPLETAQTQFERVASAVADAGRATESMTYSAAFVICAGRNEQEISRRAAAIGREVDELRSNSPLVGTPTEIADKLGAYLKIGVQRVYLQVLDMSDLEHVDFFAAEVIPQLR